MHNYRYGKPLWVALGLASMVLSGCSLPEDELREWMTQQRNTARPSIQPVSEPVKFTPQDFTSAAVVSPFSVDKLVEVLKSQMAAAANSGLLAGELNRRKEPLEAMPLDAMHMVGVLDKKQQKVALLKAENMLYQVKVGNYLGQNYGRITRISETEIVLREIVQDAAGEWVERPATLQLQEGTGK